MQFHWIATTHPFFLGSPMVLPIGFHSVRAESPQIQYYHVAADFFHDGALNSEDHIAGLHGEHAPITRFSSES